MRIQEDPGEPRKTQEDSRGQAIKEMQTRLQDYTPTQSRLNEDPFWSLRHMFGSFVPQSILPLILNANVAEDDPWVWSIVLQIGFF